MYIIYIYYIYIYMDIFELYIIAAAGAEFVPAPLSIHISITYISYIHIIYIIYICIYIINICT